MQNNKGILSAAGAYILWGLFPLYFHLIEQVPALQIVGHRIVWSFVLVIGIVVVRGELRAFRARLNLRCLLIYLAAGVLLSINWLTYVWAVNAGYVVEASLGYFINPLVSVLLGLIFLREKLRPFQWIPLGLAAVGVAYLAIAYGSIPWIALILAISFGLYGLVKKISPLDSLFGLTAETMMVFIPALGLLLFEEFQGKGAFGHLGLQTSLLLALTGIITVVPLLLFATGVRSIPLTTAGLLQYATPALQFIIGIFVLGEAFTPLLLAGFAIIWLALIIFTADGLLNRRKNVSRDLVTFPAD